MASHYNIFLFIELDSAKCFSKLVFQVVSSVQGFKTGGDAFFFDPVLVE